MTDTPNFSYIAAPRYVKPDNNLGGLYIEVRSAQGRADPADLLEFVRRDVAAAGYDPDGAGTCSLPITAGVVARSYAMWFYTKARTVVRPTPADPVCAPRRYVKLPNEKIVLVGADGYITVKVGIPLSTVINRDLDGFLDVLSEEATGSICLSDISYAVVNHCGDVLELNVTGNCADLDVEDVDFGALPLIEFQVEVTRISYGERSVRIAARTLEDALDIASDDAGNHIYPERESEYAFDAKLL
ncbi:hypothetical protein WT83_27470 [Burkholderia territorii]|uniref:Uncharacterized protein n=1 Tax=Burkholderia territorii TaxID=1503055 RepID=A0A119VDY7_9BURK|nr:hypothetical protein [Burkholderia territorii]KWN06424.1 hypothetical protein WT83_27470 [Burkholderia territorii]